MRIQNVTVTVSVTATLALMTALPVLTWAGPPTKNPACSDKINILPPRGGAGVFFDESCDTAYVLPPTVGSLELSGLSTSASPEDCTELKALEATRADLATRLERLTKSPPPVNSGSDTTIGGSGGIADPDPQVGESPGEGVDLKKVMQETDDIMKELDLLRTKSKHFTEEEGMVAKITYTLDQEALRAAYADLNRQAKVRNFVSLIPERAYLTITPVSKTLLAEHSAVLDYSVPGLSQFPHEGEPIEDAAPNGGVYFGAALSGNIRLTVKAACQIVRENGGKVPQRLKASQLEKYMAANVTYDYALNVRRSYTAEYDLHKLMQRIQSSTQQGGFLSSKTINELIERNESGSWFKFTSVSEDPRFPVEALAQTIKAEIIDRVLGQIALEKVPGSGTAPGLTQPGQKGIEAAAAGIKKCPHMYCQAAGVILDVVGASFGRSTAISNFLSTIDGTTVEKVDESKALRFYGTSTFKDVP